MDQVVAAGGASDPKVFAKNVMEIAMPPNNPANVASVNDLAKASVKTALCQPQVPCGSVAQKVFTNANITVNPVTLEPDVKSVLSKVQLGEVDAGLVYVTDVQGRGRQGEGRGDPRRRQRLDRLPDRGADHERQRATARRPSSTYVLSPAGESVLTAAGFQQP